MLDESNLETTPTSGRTNKACRLAKGNTDMARAVVDKCGAHAAAHAATVLVQRVFCPSLVESLGYRGCWKQARQELGDVTNELCKLGVVVCDVMSAVGPRLHEVIAACPPAHLAHQNVALAPSPMNHEHCAPSNARETIQSVAGLGTGLLWSDCSRDERAGWLQDHHFQQTFLNRISLPRVAPGSTCSLAPQTGA